MNAPLPASARPTLVVGGAGFIGASVVEALLASGTPVRVLDDLSSGRDGNLPLHDPNLELRTGDMLDFDCVRDAMAGMAACVHLAAQPPQSARSPRDAYDVALANILGFLNVLEAVRAAGVGRLVYASSAAVYGQAPGRPLAEDAPLRPASPLGLEKVVVEGYAELFARQHGISALGLRYFSIYGPRQEARGARAGLVVRLLERIGRRRPVLLHGDGHQTRDLLHVADAARATVAALASDFRGVCNVGSGHATSLRELVRQLGLALDVRPLMHFDGIPHAEIRHSWADVQRLREVLKVPPARTLRAGLAEMASDWSARERLFDRARLPRPATALGRRARLLPHRLHAGRALS